MSSPVHAARTSGKTTTSFFLLHLARKKYRRVGYVKPLGPKPAVLNGVEVDKDAALIAQAYGLGRDLRLMSPVVLHHDSTRKVIDGEISADSLCQRIIDACAELERKYDFLIIEGAGHGGVFDTVHLSRV